MRTRAITVLFAASLALGGVGVTVNVSRAEDDDPNTITYMEYQEKVDLWAIPVEYIVERLVRAGGYVAGYKRIGALSLRYIEWSKSVVPDACFRAEEDKVFDFVTKVGFHAGVARRALIQGRDAMVLRHKREMARTQYRFEDYYMHALSDC